jgi:hypothetical protein
MGLNAQASHGTIVSRQDNGTGGFTDVGELTDITPPSLTRNPIECLSQNDDDDTYVVGIRRKGEFTFGLNFDPNGSEHPELIDSWEGGQLDGWMVTFPDGTEWIFSGYVSGIAVQTPVDDKISAEITVRPTGGQIFNEAP